jgi:hypothetical protein
MTEAASKRETTLERILLHELIHRINNSESHEGMAHQAGQSCASRRRVCPIPSRQPANQPL